MPRIAPITLLYLRKQPIVSIKRRANEENLPQIISDGYAKIASYLAEQSEVMTDVPFVVYSPSDEEEIDIEIAFPVPYLLDGNDDISASIKPAGKAVFTMYQGPYSGMKRVLVEMRRWMDQAGLTPEGSVYEYYFNGQEYPEEDYLTKLLMPLKSS